MADKNQKTTPPRVVRRTRPRYDFGQRYVAVPDAINETLGVSDHLQRMEHQKRMAEEKQKQKQAQTFLRNNYRRRKALEQEQKRQNGQLVLEVPVNMMSDQAVDAALEQEYRDSQFRANQPVISQGYDRPDIDRLADQYAHVSNFYAALGSPNMMPMNDAQVRANPYVAAAQLDFGLNNPALTALQIATPIEGGAGALAAGKQAAIQGFKGAGNFASRFGNAIWQGTRAAGQTVARNVPKVLATTVVNAVPTMATMAADFPDDSQEGQSDKGSAIPWIIGGAATLIGGKYLYNRFNKKLGVKAATELTRPRYLTWWERHPNAVAADARFNNYANKYNTAIQKGDQAALDAMKTEFGRSPAATITQGKGKRATEVANPDFLSNTDLGTMIQERTYPIPEGQLIYTPSQDFWRRFRNLARLGIYGGVAGQVGKQIFGGNSQTPQPTMLPTAQEFGQNYQAVDSTLNKQEEPTDTVVAIPRDSVPPTPVNTFNWSVEQ